MLPKLQTKATTNKTIHVVQLASGDLWAGAEVMLYTLAKSLHTEPDVKVTVILLNHGTLEQKLRDYGIDLYILDESDLNAIQIFKQLNQIIKNIKPDVLHTHRIKENILGSIVAWRNNIPSIRTTHGAPEHRPPLHKIPKHIILLLDKIVGRRLQKKIIAVSPDLAKKLEQHFPAEKIGVIENGVDILSLTNNQPDRPPENKSNYKIGIAGRLVPIKRMDLFIDSALYVKQHHPELNVDFFIYGGGPLMAELKDQIRSGGADNTIRLVGHCDKIAAELATLDALLMTSDHEGLPMTLLEAMCLRTPIIAHAVGGIPHLLDDGRCGVLIEDHTAEAFANAIVNLIQQPEAHQQLAEQAFERVNKHYSGLATAKAYLKTYKQIAI